MRKVALVISCFAYGRARRLQTLLVEETERDTVETRRQDASSALLFALNPTVGTRPSEARLPVGDLGISMVATAEIAEAEKTKQGATVEFPPPLTPLQRTLRAVSFYKRVLPVLFNYKFTELKLAAQKDFLGKELTDAEKQSLWDEIDEWGSSQIYETIADMKGFYVKTGQVVSTRVDLFPESYTDKFKLLQDGLEPMSADLVRAVVEQELLGGQPLSELFLDFQNESLGAASIAQVHQATLLDGRKVAVKVQRPNVEPKLRGDIANLKRISKQLRGQLPVDYYTVFSELGNVLEDELNFFHEAQAMRKIGAAVKHSVDGEPAAAPVRVPAPIGDLVSRRVLVMDFIEGTPLNRLQERLKERGIDPDSPEAKLAGQRILDSLSQAFERMIFGSGFIHGDPHPGNIFIQEGGKVALIDCGQTKSIPREQRLRLAETIVQVAEYQKLKRDPKAPEAKVRTAMKALASKVQLFGVQLTELEEDKDPDELAAAVALLLFGDKDMKMPGGYSADELSENSPIKNVASFPQELVLLGRATVLLKGISARLKLPFSLADAWAPACRKILAADKKPKMPLWGKVVPTRATTAAAATTAASTAPVDVDSDDSRIRMRDTFKPWAIGKAKSVGSKVLAKMPEGMRKRITRAAAKRMLKQMQEKKAESLSTS
jgi:aarF domain-containing kinase